MKDVLKFIGVLTAAVAVMLLVRTYAFTLYRVTNTDLEPWVQRNCRVLVNKLNCSSFEKGDLIVFNNDSSYIGVIEQQPGDTVMIQDTWYVLPNKCGCKDCDCSESDYYLVNQGKSKTLVRQTEIVGKATALRFTKLMNL